MVWCPWRAGIGQTRVAEGCKLELFVHRHKWDAASQVLSIPTVDYLENAQRRCSWHIASSKIRVKWSWEDEETVQTADLIIIPKVLAGSETAGCLFNAMFTHEHSKLVSVVLERSAQTDTYTRVPARVGSYRMWRCKVRPGMAF